MNIAIIGMGELGSVLAEKFNSAGFKVKSYDKNPLISGVLKNLAQTVNEAKIIFMCVPTSANFETVKEIIKYSPKDSAIISFSKGMNLERKTASEILSDYGENHPWAVIGGPMISEDIKNDNDTVTAVIGSKDNKTVENILEIFKKSGIDAVSSSDPFALSFLGILKNVYSVGAGIIVGLNLEQTKKQILIDKSIAEMKIFCENNKIDSKIVDGPAGIGDFLITSSSPNSRNRAMGIEFGKTNKTVVSGEALNATSKMIQRFPFIKEKMPLFSVIAEIIEQKQPSKSIFKIL